MWPISRKKPLPEVTTAVYARWLRAQRPPFTWFAGLSEPEQEALAACGDGYAENFAIAVGYAVQDPAAAAAGVDSQRGDPEAESELLHRMAAATVQRLLAAKPASAPKPAAPTMSPPTMAGIRGFPKRTERKEATG